MRAIYFRERRKKAAKEQDTVSNVKLEEFESSEINISADEFEEEEDIYKKDKSFSIDNDIHSETEEDENDDFEENEMLIEGLKFTVNTPRFLANMQGILRRNARQV